MRLKPDIDCVVHPAICSSSTSTDVLVGIRSKQSNTDLRRGDLGKGVWLSAENVIPFF